jgi:hypothetical protein
MPRSSPPSSSACTRRFGHSPLHEAQVAENDARDHVECSDRDPESQRTVINKLGFSGKEDDRPMARLEPRPGLRARM